MPGFNICLLNANVISGVVHLRSVTFYCFGKMPGNEQLKRLFRARFKGTARHGGEGMAAAG